jgi:hypothetical protein
MTFANLAVNKPAGVLVRPRCTEPAAGFGVPVIYRFSGQSIIGGAGRQINLYGTKVDNLFATAQWR